MKEKIVLKNNTHSDSKTKKKSINRSTKNPGRFQNLPGFVIYKTVTNTNPNCVNVVSVYEYISLGIYELNNCASSVSSILRHSLIKRQ